MPADFLADAPLTKSLAQANATLDVWQIAQEQAPTNWSPPVIYDPPTDSYRVATQQDVDDLCARFRTVSILYSGILRAFRDAGGSATLPLDNVSKPR